MMNLSLAQVKKFGSEIQSLRTKHEKAIEKANDVIEQGVDATLASATAFGLGVWQTRSDHQQGRYRRLIQASGLSQGLADQVTHAYGQRTQQVRLAVVHTIIMLSHMTECQIGQAQSRLSLLPASVSSHLASYLPSNAGRSSGAGVQGPERATTLGGIRGPVRLRRGPHQRGSPAGRKAGS